MSGSRQKRRKKLVDHSGEPSTSMSSGGGNKANPAAGSGTGGGGVGQQLEGSGTATATATAAAPAGQSDVDDGNQMVILPGGLTLPRSALQPLTVAVLKHAAEAESSSSSLAEATSPVAAAAAMDDDVRKLAEASRQGGYTMQVPVLEFLAKDVPAGAGTAVGSTSRKRIQQVLAEDLAVSTTTGAAAAAAEQDDVIRARYPSQAEIEKMPSLQLFAFLNNLQAKYSDLIKRRVQAEEALDEAEAKAKRERANLDKMKREHGRKGAARRKRTKEDEDEDEDEGDDRGAGLKDDVVMAGTEEEQGEQHEGTDERDKSIGHIAEQAEGGGSEDQTAEKGTTAPNHAGDDAMDLS